MLDQVRAMGRAGSYVQQVDILINNAGIAHNAALEDMTETEWERMIRMNLTSVFLCCQAVAAG